MATDTHSEIWPPACHFAASEHLLRIVAIETLNGGQRAVSLYSLIASCKANQVEPWAYLRDIFTRLPTLPAEESALSDSELDQILPRSMAVSPPPAPL